MKQLGFYPQLEVLIRRDIKSWRRPGLGWWKKHLVFLRMRLVKNVQNEKKGGIFSDLVFSYISIEAISLLVRMNGSPKKSPDQRTLSQRTASSCKFPKLSNNIFQTTIAFLPFSRCWIQLPPPQKITDI